LVRIAYLEFAKKSEEVVSNKEEVLRSKRKTLESSQQCIESVKIFKAQYVTSEGVLVRDQLGRRRHHASGGQSKNFARSIVMDRQGHLLSKISGMLLEYIKLVEGFCRHHEE
jgi:hypothetical protein